MGRYYVYRLIDPRTNEAFYIGKGCGNRISHHEALAKRGIVDNAGKFQAIRSIWGAGMQVRREFVQGDLTEDQAFALERRLISQGQSLTNVAPGCSTEQQRAQARAGHMLEQLKPCAQWMETAPAGAIDRVRRLFGDPHAFYSRFERELRTLAGV